MKKGNIVMRTMMIGVLAFAATSALILGQSAIFNALAAA